jgi:hypothetical protein
VVVWSGTKTVVETGAVVVGATAIVVGATAIVVGATAIVVGATAIVVGATVASRSLVSDTSWIAEVHAAEKPRTIAAESHRIPTRYR